MLLVECDETLRKHLRRENGKWVICARCNKIVCGRMSAVLMAFKKLAKFLKEWGHEMSSHDPYVWNNIVEGSQLALLFHTDNALMARELPQIVADRVNLLDRGCGSNDPLIVALGKMNECLGVTVDFRREISASFSQYDVVKKLWVGFPDELCGNHRSYPAPENLLKVDANSPQVPRSMNDDHHSAVSKCLCFSQRSRTDLKFPIGFHCTRVKDPREQDTSKFKHVSGHMWLTRLLPLVVAIDGKG